MIAKDEIIALNKKYNREKEHSFFLFHRPRKWNEKEKKMDGLGKKAG
jgi:hypothetical protein